MSNQLISSEYLYKGKIYYYLVKYPICPGNKQIYNDIIVSHIDIFTTIHFFELISWFLVLDIYTDIYSR